MLGDYLTEFASDQPGSLPLARFLTGGQASGAISIVSIAGPLFMRHVG